MLIKVEFSVIKKENIGKLWIELKNLEDKNSENLGKILGLKSVVFYEKGEIEKAIEINKKAYKLFPYYDAIREQREKYSKILDKINQET